LLDLTHAHSSSDSLTVTFSRAADPKAAPFKLEMRNNGLMEPSLVEKLKNLPDADEEDARNRDDDDEEEESRRQQRDEEGDDGFRSDDMRGS
jgi:hypothetical protein